ncbi:MAG: hypothetical protein LBD21_09240, partial [Tannerellaceae bacterium]|nr:hypothetical protein [Tannerellaceae bacterium]
FDVLCQILNGLRLSAVDQTEIDLLDASIEIINSTTDQFTTIANRRLGTTASKTDDGKKDENTQTSDTQTPDTSPTPAPDTSDQNPSDEPHHLDPGEHPAMGE